MKTKCPVCPVCSGPGAKRERTVRDHQSRESFELARCPGCGVLFVSNPPTAEELPRYYENPSGRNMTEKPSRVFSLLRNVLIGRDLGPIFESVPKGELVADLGAGDGALVDLLRARGYDARAVDFSPEAAHSLDMNRPDLKPEHFKIEGRIPSAVVLRHVLEHLLRPTHVIRCLRELGVRHVILIVPNEESWLARAFGESWYYWDPPRHLLHFNHASLAELARLAGYRVKARHTYGIDEVVTSIHRGLMLSGRGGSAARALFHPKSPLAGLSSAGSTFFMNTICWAHLELARELA
jgi:hypothetical protein